MEKINKSILENSLSYIGKTVDVIIDSLTFAGIITEINVYITIEVE